MIAPLDLPSYGYAPADPAAPPVVSVITPYYQTGALFLDTATTLLRQSLQQWEWIIVNDGSTDPEALRVLLAFRSADPRIRVIDQPNRGPAAARNVGAAVARAPFLFFLDSDNLLEPTALEKLVWSLVSRPASSFACSWTRVFGAVNHDWRFGFDSRTRFPAVNTPNSQAMARQAAFAELGGFDEQYRAGLEDWEFWVRAAAHGFWGHDLPETLVWDRRKAAAEYPGYQWGFRKEPGAIGAFRAQLRQRYPRVFRAGPPTLPGDGGLLDTHALLQPELPFANRLQQPTNRRRILALFPAMRTGGSDRYALDLIAGLVARGDRVTVCLTRGDMHHDWLDDLRRLTPDVFIPERFLRAADIPRFLHYLIESRGITTVLNSYSLLGYQLLPYLRAYAPAPAYIDYQHAEQPERSGGFPRVGIEHTDLIDLHITASHHLRNWMIERGAESERVKVCTINIDTQRWRPDPELRNKIRAELGTPEERAVIVFTGRLSAEKRPALMIDILRMLHAAGVPFEAWIIGDGEDGPYLHSFVQRHNLTGCIRLFGIQPNTRVYELLNAADLFLLPSQREGIAYTLYESLAVGVVPVAADVGGQRELITPECGVLIPHGPYERDEYAAALRRLIEQPEVRRRMAAAGRTRVVEQFDQQHMISRMQMLFDRAGEYHAERPRPAVAPGTGLAVATLAIEHFRLEQRLRALPPLRLILWLRWSSFGRMLLSLKSARRLLERGLRGAYALRRELMDRMQRHAP